MRKPGILILGPNLNKSNPGGVVFVIKTFLKSDIALDFDLDWTHLEFTGSLVRKVFQFVSRPIAVAWKLRKNDYDLVHVHASLYNSLISRLLIFVLLKKLSKTPFLIQFHGGNPQLINNKSLFARLLQNFDKILVLTKQQKTELITLLPETKIEIIPNYYPSPEDKNIIKPENPVHILFLARMEKSKGIYILLRAIESLYPKYSSKLFFDIAGSGVESERVKELIHESKINTITKFHGFVSGVQKEDLLRKSSIFVLPTSHDEGFPMGILEAMSYQNAIISTDRGSIKSLVKESNGIIIEEGSDQALAKALVQLIEDREHLKSLCKNSFIEFTKNFDINSKGREFFKHLYNSIKG